LKDPSGWCYGEWHACSKLLEEGIAIVKDGILKATTDEITALLRSVEKGDKDAEDRLIRVVYPELRRMARRQMRQERAGHTLQATALVHEAYLKLTAQADRTWESRTEFLALAANLMRQILIDHARARLRKKRGGGEVRTSLNDFIAGPGLRPAEMIELDECLCRLAARDPRQGQIVELRFFGGLSVDEVAQQLAVSPKTVKRDWSVARAWLYREMRRNHGTRDRSLGESEEPVRRRAGGFSGKA
jgi:RNA polymerase sigma-70 factor, ECF subfamily